MRIVFRYFVVYLQNIEKKCTDMELKIFRFNQLQVNTYLLIDEETRDAIIIDPGCQSMEERMMLKEYIDSNNIHLVRLLNTHLHFDHVYGNRFVQETFGIGAEGSKEDIFFLNHYTDLLALFDMPLDDDALPLSNKLKEGDVVSVGDIHLKVLHVPGHSPGRLAFYDEASKCAFIGDTILEGEVGRTDLHRGNYDTLIKSITEKIMSLPDDTALYSGHGDASTVWEERLNNPHLKICKKEI